MTKRALAGGVALASIGWLVVTADASAPRALFFGLWRTGALMVGFAGLLVALGLVLAARSPLALGRFLLVMLSAAFALGFLELAGHLGVIDYQALFEPPHAGLGTVPVPHLDEQGRTPEDIATNWGVESTSHPFRFRTGRRGFRNDRDRASADVYLVGDSILVAAAVPFEDTLAGRIEAETGLATMNIALIGISVQRELELLRHANVDLDGSLVVHFVFEGNDLPDSAAYRAAQSGGGDESRPSRSLLQRLAVMGQRLSDGRVHRPDRLICTFEGEEAFFGWDRISFEGVEGEVPHLTSALGEARDMVQGRGGTYVVAFVPSKLRVLGPRCRWRNEDRGYEAHIGPLRAELGHWAQESGTHFVDTTAALSSVAENGESPWLMRDTHPNGLGHRAMTRAVLAADPVRRWREARPVAGSP